jgi:hypothetical protein
MAAGGTRTAPALRSIVEIYEDINDGYDYELYNIWADIMLQDLYLVEFATAEISSQAKDNIMYGNRGVRLKNGETDVISSASGVINVSQNASYLSPMKYRHIENIFGNGLHFIDGITVENGVIKVTDKTGTQISSLRAPQDTGYVHKLGFDPVTKLVYPVQLADEGKAAYGDGYSNSKGLKMLFKGWSSKQHNGMFNYNLMTSTDSNPRITARMIRYIER